MSDAPSQRDAAIALLAFYREAGIETLFLDAPRDRFAETAAEIERRQAKRQAEPASPPLERKAAGPAQRSEDRGSPSRPNFGEPAGNGTTDSAFPSTRVAIPDEIAIADARERARAAATLAELKELLDGFEGCNLKITAKHTVFGDGPQTADLMLIGEAPGRDEDMAGVPFVGRSGQLLDRMLEAIGLEREKVRVTNTVPWRPPGNRAPTPAETQICLPFIQRQIELVAPKILVCLGSPGQGDSRLGRGDLADARQVAELQLRPFTRLDDPGDRHAASGLSPAPARPEAPRLA